MSKRMISVISLVSMLLLCGCQKTDHKQTLMPDNETEEYLLTLPDQPSENDQYFLVTNGGLVNEDLWYEFLDSCSQGKAVDLTFGQYTIEGDVIYTLLSYDGDRYIATMDNSRDQFGKPQFFEYEGKHLNYFEWTTMEEYSDGVHQALNRMACLSGEEYTEPDEMIADLREGKTDVILLWSDQRKDN